MTEKPTIQKFDLTDMEGDGVIKARDNCPDSYVDSQVNNDGCGTETIETVRRVIEISFDRNSYFVKQEYYSEIEKIADFMNEFPQSIVTIEGHTSIRGSVQLNQYLSENRAIGVKNILSKQFNIAAERITAIGYGSEKLLLEGDDEYIHARNRRIVAEISSDKNLIDMKWNIYSVDKDIE